MKLVKYKIAKDIGPEKWPPLPRLLKAGEVIYRWTTTDYGCARDDAVYGRRETISCSLQPGVTPFFTIPVEFLLVEESPDGNPHPQGDFYFA